MPVTNCWVEEVDDVAALRLLAVVVLPMILPVTVFVPASTSMPISEAEMAVEGLPLVSAPWVVMEPMVLLAMTTVPVLTEPMPKVAPPVPEVVTEIEPVPVPLPTVLPMVVPMFTDPAATLIPIHTPAIPAENLLLVQIMFVMVLP